MRFAMAHRASLRGMILKRLAISGQTQRFAALFQAAVAKL
jgi:hypothetical protein